MILICLFDSCKEVAETPDPVTWIYETVDFTMRNKGRDVESLQGYQTKEVKFRFIDENGKPIKTLLDGRIWYGDSLIYDSLKVNIDEYENPDMEFYVLEKDCVSPVKCYSNFDSDGFLTKELRMNESAIIEFEFSEGNGSRFAFVVPGNEQSKIYELTLKRSDLGLQKMRIANVQAVTTQSVYLKFKDSDGDKFKTDFQMKVWYFDNSKADSTIRNLYANNQLGSPNLVSSSKLKNFMPNCEVRKILRFNTKALILFEFPQGQSNNYGTFMQILTLPNRDAKPPRNYPHFEVGAIDRFRGGFGVGC